MYLTKNRNFLGGFNTAKKKKEGMDDIIMLQPQGDVVFHYWQFLCNVITETKLDFSTFIRTFHVYNFKTFSIPEQNTASIAAKRTSITKFDDLEKLPM